MTDEKLVQLAMLAKDNAYAPYSKFSVGAALLCEDGSVITGCNVENATYGATICAERTAAAHAVSQGKVKFTKIAIVGSNSDFCVPCGICRQFLIEFTDDLIFLCANNAGEYRRYSFSDLLPNAFTL